jgi:DNA sulfur modification protein DndD
MRFIITSIELTNFRQYRDHHVIELAFDKKKNVAIVKGRNGAGKSNLLNALTWCFYDVETHSTYEDNEKMPIVNTSELVALKPNQKIQAEVKIYLDTDRGPWTIKRTLAGGKHPNGEIYVEEDSTLSVAHPVGGQDKVETGKDTEVLINNLLPHDLKSFFFMDGEKLREFFNKDTNENIGESIEKVSQLDLMYKAADHLEAHEKELRKGVKESTPKLDQIDGEIQFLQTKLEKLKGSIDKHKDETKDNNKELKDVKDFLKNCGIEHVEQLEQERQTIEEDVKTINGSMHSKVLERNKYLVKMAPFIYLKKPIESALKMVGLKIEKGELPPKIKETLVLELIERGKCICGTKIVGDAKKILEKYVKTLSLSELGEVSIVGKTKFKDILLDIEKFSDVMDGFYKEITSFEEQLAVKSRRLEQIKDELKIGEDKTKIINYERRRDELITHNARIEQQMKMDLSEEKEARSLLDTKRSEYEKELGSSEKNKRLKAKLKLVQDTLKTLADTEIIIKDKIREQIQTNTENNFFKLIRKKGAFKKVIINENYEVVVKHESGYNVIDHLSAGEYMILGLSFMSALMTISGFKAPVIIDTPLGKIDDEHRDKITTELPIFLDGTQLILFVTPTEYDAQVKSNLSKFITKGNFYEIVENTKQNESKVVRK